LDHLFHKLIHLNYWSEILRPPLLATALGVQAIEHHRRRVLYFSTVELVNAFEKEKAQGKAGKIAEALIKADLVILDEPGYLPFSKLYERTSVVITTKPELQRIGNRVWRCQNDHRLARSANPPVLHFGNWQ
jgi:hypothetical protein